MNGLSVEEMEELAQEMAEMAQSGAFFRARHAERKGNLMHSGTFLESAGHIADRERDHSPEYAINADLTLLSTASESRERILRILQVFKREEAAKPQDIFSKRFIEEFDWITDKRQKLVDHAVKHQRAFVSELYNPLLLQPLKQEDLSFVINCHTTTVSRLVRGLLLEFPDTSVRAFAILVPGLSLQQLQGRYVVGLLARNERYYDRAAGWKVSDEELCRILQTEYRLDVQRRAVTNYRTWVDEHLLKRRRTPEMDVEQHENEQDASDVIE